MMNHFWDGFEKRAGLEKVALPVPGSALPTAAVAAAKNVMGGVKKQLTHKDYLKNIGWNPAKNQAMKPMAAPMGQVARVSPEQAGAARMNHLKTQMNPNGMVQRAILEG